MARTLKSILKAQGRLRKLTPVAIIDIGSNSVRLVIYEGLSRSPTPLFNEKVLCGLGAHIATTNRLDDEAIARALAALKRFRVLIDQAGADSVHTLATAAAREAKNGPSFIRKAQAILGERIHVLTGPEEAHYAALGVVCGFSRPDGISADMGGGSVELMPVADHPIGEGVTFPFGGLRLMEMTGGDLRKARQMIAESLGDLPMLRAAQGQAFYAVGGTWRAFGRLYQKRTNHPLSVMHHQVVPVEEAKKLCKRLMGKDAGSMRGMSSISSSRQALLPYGAALLYEIIKAMNPSQIVISAAGVREGYLFSLLPEKVQRGDPLITAAEEMAVLRARSPAHAKELTKWTGEAFRVLDMEETRDEARYRKAACLLADITWRAHPDYRGDQAVSILSNANFYGIDHPGRAYIALASYFRHEGIGSPDKAPAIAAIAGERIGARAHLLGALFRVAYLMTAAMPDLLPRTRLRRRKSGALVLEVPKDLRNLMGERLQRRLDGLANLVGEPIAFALA